MKNSLAGIYPCIWVEKPPKEVFDFYQSVFDNSGIDQDYEMVVYGRLENSAFMILGGNNNYRPNSSISFMVMSKDKEKTDRYYQALIKGGSALMPLDSYEWSSHYGWVIDKYGISWQLYTEDDHADEKSTGSIVPTLMFANEQQGRCREALEHYRQIFPSMRIDGILDYPSGEFAGQVMHTQFKIQDFTLMAMDSGVPQTFSFNDTISLTLLCKDQGGVDYYWDRLLKEGNAIQCGWLVDKFGIRWQVVPDGMDKLLFEHPQGEENMKRMMGMIKLNIEELVH